MGKNASKNVDFQKETPFSKSVCKGKAFYFACQIFFKKNYCLNHELYGMTLSADLLSYCEAHTTPPEPLLTALERETHLRTLSPQMLSGALQGQLLRFISLLLRPAQILEIGTFTGYSAICLASGLPEHGHLHTIEVNDELAPLIRRYIAQSARANQITLHVGDAASIVPTLEGPFDLVLLDAGKLDYPDHYNMVLPMIRPGGFLLADNVLWDGKVVRQETDQTAAVLHAFNQQIHADPSVENVLLPVRDGLMLVRKKD
jgi:predicted O-methyltransferase YrrM